MSTPQPGAAPDDLRVSDPKALSALMSLAGGGADEITIPPHELAAMWRHQLGAPLTFDLKDVEPDPTSLAQMTHAGERELETFGQLLDDPQPPVELLQIVKEFAKSQSAGGEPLLPKPIGSALYYAAIATARLRCGGQRISALDDAELRRGVEWAVQQAWLDEGTRQLFAQALESIAPA